MNRLVPKLRFKEFSGEWEKKRLNNICDINPKVDNLPNNFIYIDLESVVAGELIQENEIKKENAPSRAQRLLKNGDVIYQMVRPYQKNNLFLNFENNKDYVASTGYAQLRAFNSNSFLYQLIHIDTFVNKVLENSTGSNYPAINSKELSKIKVIIPKSTQEQQKIANTLNSLDNLIETNSKKLEALKEHKKGLMQQLFPTDDEKVPKLRFKEFIGEWEEKKLGDIGKASMCKRILKNQTNTQGDIPFFKIGTFGKKADAFINKKLFEEYKYKYSYPKIGDILISASGTIGRLVIFDGVPAYFQDSNIVWIDNNEKIIKNSFLYYCYKNIKWITDDSTISRLYNDNLRNIKILIPKSYEEQQKIANCLNSLDNLIEATQKKVEALKKHKKGLMQQMFVNGDN